MAPVRVDAVLAAAAEAAPRVRALLAALLERALQKAAQTPETAVIAARITLVKKDSVAVMRETAPEARPDTVYLDPMYPERKKSARSAKEMEILRMLCGRSRDGDLLAAALAAAGNRVVVKRPRSAPPLCGRNPDFSLRGPAHRFDVYVRGKRTERN
jgi:16S rRNA (guanine1516-N2)-methyltransferase